MNEQETPYPWLEQVKANPDHSQWYAQRWRDIEAQGMDIDGEARTIDAMAQRNSRILDAGAGTGRVGGYLLNAGHTVVGVDIDEYLVEIAKQDHPHGQWHVGELGSFELEKVSETNFDIIFSCGNVMAMLRPEDRVVTLKRFASYLADGGRAIIGYAAGRGYEFSDFFADAAEAGLAVQARFGTWQLEPYEEDGGFLVAVLVKA